MVLRRVWNYLGSCRSGGVKAGSKGTSGSPGRSTEKGENKSHNTALALYRSPGNPSAYPIGVNRSLGVSAVTPTLELRNCRGPNCYYKAPVCEYGYCAKCCEKIHTFGVSALINHVRPTLGPVEHGYKVIEHGYSTPTKKEPGLGEAQVSLNPSVVSAPVPVVLATPECGTLTDVVTLDFPIEESSSGYSRPSF